MKRKLTASRGAKIGRRVVSSRPSRRLGR